MTAKTGLVVLVLAAGLAACTGNEVDPVTVQGVTLLRYEALPSSDFSGNAIGALVVYNGCIGLGIMPDDPDADVNDNYLVWPADHDLRQTGSGLEVVDGQGAVVGRIGDRIRVPTVSVGLAAQAQRYASIPQACRATVGGYCCGLCLASGGHDEEAGRT